MTCFLIKNYKINLHIRNSQTGTKLKPIFAIDSQTHASKKKFINPPMREREGERVKKPKRLPAVNSNCKFVLNSVFHLKSFTSKTNLERFSIFFPNWFFNKSIFSYTIKKFSCNKFSKNENTNRFSWHWNW